MLIGSSLKGIGIPDLGMFSIDKLLHIIEYFIFGVLLYFSFYNFLKHPVIVCLTIGVLYGIIDELYQSTVYGRSSSSLDVLADIIGLILSAFFVKLYFNSIGNDKEVKY